MTARSARARLGAALSMLIAAVAVAVAAQQPGPLDSPMSKDTEIKALDLATARPLCRQPLPAAPVPNGLCVDGAGRIIAVLEGGRVVAFAAK